MGMPSCRTLIVWNKMKKNAMLMSNVYHVYKMFGVSTEAALRCLIEVSDCECCSRDSGIQLPQYPFASTTAARVDSVNHDRREYKDAFAFIPDNI